MSYKDEPNVHLLGASGAYGDMPSSMYLRKIEMTNIAEDPNQVENYMRASLADKRPDLPFLASDEMRYDNHSKERLSMRYSGARTEEEPYLPDGTFLEMDSLAPDPRSTMLQPDMRQHVKQQYARAAFIKFYDDSSHNVPESGINPVQMVENIKSGMYQFKDRYQNFEESKDSWHNGGTMQKRYQGGDIANITMDGTIMDLTESSRTNRSDAVSKLSNDPTIAFRHSTPDHRVKIARYGVIRANQSMDYQRWNDNRLNSMQDHANMAIINGELVNKMLANYIIDLEGLRKTKQAVAQGATYGDSAVIQQRSKKRVADDIYKIMRIASVSHTPHVSTQLEGGLVQRYGIKPQPNNRKLAEQVQINHEILKSMERAVHKKAQRTKESDEQARRLREQIYESACDVGMYVESNTRKDIRTGQKSENTVRRSIDQRHIEEQLTISNYTGIKPMKHNTKHENTDYEEYGADAHQNQMHMRQYNSRNMTADDAENTQQFNAYDFNAYNKAEGMDVEETKGRGHVADFGDMLQDEAIGTADLATLYG